jgi:methylmalonyl-CoA/ethylmalonyl-CoA epimerase
MSSMGITGVRQIAVIVEDVERATAFYRDVLGLELLFSIPDAAFFDCGGTRLYLTPGEEGVDAGSSILYFRVPDMDAAVKALEDGGGTLEREAQLTAQMEDHDLWLAFFRDSEGNLMSLLSEVPRV